MPPKHPEMITVSSIHYEDLYSTPARLILRSVRDPIPVKNTVK